MREATLKDIAQILQRKKQIGEPPVLFLGSRTGLFYGHEKLYEYVKQTSKIPTAFDGFSNPQKFQECYHVLNGERFSLGEVDELLKEHLGNQPEVRPEDVCMAELINEGYFDVVISTTIDPLLQEGLTHQRTWQNSISSNTKLLLFNDRSVDAITMQYAKNTIKVIKIFGDLEARKYYTVHNHLNIDDKENEKLKKYIEELFARPTLIIGFDPDWDRPLERVFPKNDEDIIYINEEKPGEKSYMEEMLQVRNGRGFIGDQSEYSVFLSELHREIFQDGPLSFTLAQKLLMQLKTMQIHAKNREDGHRKQIEAMSYLVQTLQQDIGELHTQIQLLQDIIQRLLNTYNYTERKDD